jgi:hypothetical protein
MTTATYTGEQLRLALVSIGMPGHGDVGKKEVRALAAAALRRLAGEVRLSGVTPDPICGMTYDPRRAPERAIARRLIALRGLFERLHPEVPLWPHAERERLKREAWRVVHDRSLLLAQRIEGARDVMRAHFARSAWATMHAYSPLSFVLHPGFEEYSRHYLHSEPAHVCESFGADVGQALLVGHSRPDCLRIGPGRSYWVTS